MGQAWINVYRTGEAWGGAEEGGWTYKYGTCIEALQVGCCGNDGIMNIPHTPECFAFKLWEHKLMLTQGMNAHYLESYTEFPENEDAPTEYAGERITGDGVVVRLESEKGRDYPERRPHYE